MAQDRPKRVRVRLQVLSGVLGRSGRPGDAPRDLDGLLRDAIELRAEVLALRDLFEDAEFLAWALQRALAGHHPDLRLLARFIHEQLAWLGQ